MARTEQPVRPPDVRTASTNGDGRGTHDTAAPSRVRPGKVLRPPGLLILGAASIVVAGLGFFFFRDQAAYVSTDNAIVTGAVVQLGSPNAGQIRAVNVEVGDDVVRGQVLATVALSPPQNNPTASVVSVNVRSPIDGVIIGRQVNPGDAVASGRSLVSIVDPSSLWVQAQIDESQIGRVHAGQRAEVWIAALGQTLRGQVIGVAPASSNAASQAPGNAASLPQRTTQLVPVRVNVDYGPLWLVLGSSASLKINVQD